MIHIFRLMYIYSIVSLSIYMCVGVCIIIYYYYSFKLLKKYLNIIIIYIIIGKKHTNDK